MKRITVLGAGRSSHTLIEYLYKHSAEDGYELLVADRDVQDLAKHFPSLSMSNFDVHDGAALESFVSEADVLVSMLPARFHPIVAKECVKQSKHMVTASYVSDEMNALNDEATKKGVMLINEVGVDPGIDHMSAKKVIDELQGNGAHIHSFESFTGGLPAPESDNNPWHYKFTWNPRNVVLAGQGGAVKFIQEGRYKYIPYHQLFRRTEIIHIDDYGKFEGYANRDSLWYRTAYGLEDAGTIYRGTLRRHGFCKAWDTFVKIGATDDSYVLENTETMTNREFINTFLPYNKHDSVELKLMHLLKIDQDSVVMAKLEWLGIFEDTLIGLKEATPAQVLQHILEQKWSLDEGDKDMIVMWHRFGYEIGGEEKEIHASMVCIGDDEYNTAMSKTVGLPVGIFSRAIIQGKLDVPGVHIPTKPSLYNLCLGELEKAGILFREKQVTPRHY